MNRIVYSIAVVVVLTACVGCLPLFLLALSGDPFEDPGLQRMLVPCTSEGKSMDNGLAEGIDISCGVLMVSVEGIRYGEEGSMLTSYIENNSEHAIWIDPAKVHVSYAEEEGPAQPALMERTILMHTMQESIYVIDDAAVEELYYGFRLKPFHPFTSCHRIARRRAGRRWPPSTVSERSVRVVHVPPGQEVMYRWTFGPMQAKDIVLSFDLESEDGHHDSVSIPMCLQPPLP